MPIDRPQEAEDTGDWESVPSKKDIQQQKQQQREQREQEKQNELLRKKELELMRYEKLKQQKEEQERLKREKMKLEDQEQAERDEPGPASKSPKRRRGRKPKRKGSSSEAAAPGTSPFSSQSESAQLSPRADEFAPELPSQAGSAPPEVQQPETVPSEVQQLEAPRAGSPASDSELLNMKSPGSPPSDLRPSSLDSNLSPIRESDHEPTSEDLERAEERRRRKERRAKKGIPKNFLSDISKPPSAAPTVGVPITTQDIPQSADSVPAVPLKKEPRPSESEPISANVQAMFDAARAREQQQSAPGRVPSQPANALQQLPLPPVPQSEPPNRPAQMVATHQAQSYSAPASISAGSPGPAPMPRDAPPVMQDASLQVDMDPDASLRAVIADPAAATAPAPQAATIPQAPAPEIAPVPEAASAPEAAPTPEAASAPEAAPAPKAKAKGKSKAQPSSKGGKSKHKQPPKSAPNASSPGAGSSGINREMKPESPRPSSGEGDPPLSARQRSKQPMSPRPEEVKPKVAPPESAPQVPLDPHEWKTEKRKGPAQAPGEGMPKQTPQKAANPFSNLQTSPDHSDDAPSPPGSGPLTPTAPDAQTIQIRGESPPPASAATLQALPKTDKKASPPASAKPITKQPEALPQESHPSPTNVPTLLPSTLAGRPTSGKVTRQWRLHQHHQISRPGREVQTWRTVEFEEEDTKEEHVAIGVSMYHISPALVCICLSFTLIILWVTRFKRKQKMDKQIYILFDDVPNP